MSPAPEPEFPTVDVKRETLAMRLLSPALTQSDRDFVRAQVLWVKADWCRMRLSNRLQELVPELVAKG
jgi:hypothetical protein